jgi:hypothetical protein
MNDDEAVTFTQYYDQYRSSVKACLFPWLLAGIILLIFSTIKYSRQVHSKVIDDAYLSSIGINEILGTSRMDTAH